MSGGIFGYSYEGTKTNCYAANGQWSDTAANAVLAETDGSVWTDIDLSNDTTPYRLSVFTANSYNPVFGNVSYATLFNSSSSGSNIFENGIYKLISINNINPNIFNTLDHSVTINETSGNITFTNFRIVGEYTVKMLGTFSNGSYVIGSYSLNVTSVPCFMEGTKILCKINEQDIEIPIENIKIGMLVKNYNGGYTKVVHKTITQFDNNIIDKREKLYKLAKCGDMTDDLIVTGTHMIPVLRPYGSIILKRYIPAYKHENFKQINNISSCTVHNLVLETEKKTDSCSIFANGFLCESMSMIAYEKLHKPVKDIARFK